MNILFLSTWFPHPPDNGSKLRAWHLLRALGQGHEVHLLSFAFATAPACWTCVAQRWGVEVGSALSNGG